MGWHPFGPLWVLFGSSWFFFLLHFELCTVPFCSLWLAFGSEISEFSFWNTFSKAPWENTRHPCLRTTPSLRPRSGTLPQANSINRSAPCLPTRQVRVREEPGGSRALLFRWLPDVYFCWWCWMQKGTLTWSLQRNSLPPPALQARGPSGRIAFLRFIFALFFVMFFWIVFHVSLIDVDLHLCSILA